MQLKFRDWRPTGFDPRGLGLPDRQDWRVAGARTRDSASWRFNRELRRLGGESQYVEVHRFRHWAVGWLELILVSPDRPRRKAVTS